ncbi:MAG: ABC transporter ATP-binding protein [bacterium]|nr:MAG: ABC transporter ATP-binding protein [bacterium]
MTEPVIKVENLSKQYRLGAAQGYKTFREAIVNATKAPLDRLKKVLGKSDNGNNPMPHAPGSLRSPNSDTIWALNDVSFDVQQGEVVGIIGRNGAGKSTLLKILSKITEPTRGRVKLKGRVGSLLEVGTGFHPELTGHENIYLYGAILGMDRWEVTRKFHEIVDFAELEKFIDTPVKRYSSGMYTRLAFAVAAHLETEILLVDEVLAVGDMAFQKKCFGKMGDVVNEGRTILFVSHNMAAVRKLCKNAILLDSGEIIEFGDVSKCINSYLSGESDSLGKIVDNIRKKDDSLEIESISINDSPNNQITLPSDMDYLKIEITGKTSQPKRIDIESVLYDLYYNPLAFFSPGHEKGYADSYPAGDFKIQKIIKLPKIMRGDYILSLGLLTPNVCFWLEIPHAVRIMAEGSPTSTGKVFDYYYNKIGWMWLSEK